MVPYSGRWSVIVPCCYPSFRWWGTISSTSGSRPTDRPPKGVNPSRHLFLISYSPTFYAPLNPKADGFNARTRPIHYYYDSSFSHLVRVGMFFPLAWQHHHQQQPSALLFFFFLFLMMPTGDDAQRKRNAKKNDSSSATWRWEDNYPLNQHATPSSVDQRPKRGSSHRQ